MALVVSSRLSNGFVDTLLGNSVIEVDRGTPLTGGNVIDELLLPTEFSVD